MLLPGCGKESTRGDVKSEGDLGSQVQGDIEALSAALSLERGLVSYYEAAEQRVRGDHLETANGIGELEREHVRRLEDAVRNLGGDPRTAVARGVDVLDGTARDYFALAGEVERNAIAFYIDLLPKLAHADLRGTLARLVADEAEHLAVVDGLAGKPQATEPFVVGDKAKWAP